MSALEYDRKRAMKRKDFTKCLCCSKPMMHAGGMFFYRVTIERMGVDVRAARRQMGMEMMMGGGIGGAVLAAAMGPDEDLGIPIGDADSGLVCDQCALRSQSCLGQLSETAGERKEEAERKRAEREAASQQSGVVKHQEPA